MSLNLIFFEIGNVVVDAFVSQELPTVMRVLRALAFVYFYWIVYQHIAAMYDEALRQEAEQPRFTIQQEAEQFGLSALSLLAGRIINDSLSNRVDATFDNLFGLYYALKHRFPEATLWKLVTHSAHGHYFDLTFRHRAQEVTIGVMHDQDAHEKRFFFSNAYFEKSAEVISAIESSIKQ